jgi:hypothetical protein
MARVEVESSAIRSVGYDFRRATLDIEFVHGGLYRYFDVPASLYDAFMQAESKGQFFHAEIRDRFRFERL